MLIDVMCPLTNQQRQQYVRYQRGLRINDDALEKELLQIDNKSMSTSSSALNDEKGGIHPLRAMLNLNLLCVHPRLMREENGHNGDDDNWDNSSSIYESGKLLRLAQILVESLVVSRDGACI